jgi:hypothetical protein
VFPVWFALGFLFFSWAFLLPPWPTPHRTEFDDVAAQETETCMKQAPKDPAWFGSVYCSCVMQQTQNKISYSDYQAVTKEITTPDAATGRPAFEKNKGAMESIARTCMVLVQKRALKEKSLAGDGVSAP